VTEHRSEVVDTHLHYWQWPRDGAARAAAEARARRASAPVEDELAYQDVAATMAAAGVAHAVQVTRTLSGYDNSYSLEGARALPSTFRVCGRFDPSGADVKARLRAFFDDPAVVALRLFSYSDAGDWLGDESLEGFWRAAEELRVPVCVYAPGRVAAVDDVAGRRPGLRLIVDHAGADLFEPPGRRFEEWDVLGKLARFDNVYVKVSALPEATMEPFPFPAAQARVQQLYEQFGPDRLMWGSNYPLTTRVCTYAEALDLVRVACPFLTDGDRDKVLGETARSVFCL
jgi:predicted TIM-barrel fold metal-dependent hydrolase